MYHEVVPGLLKAANVKHTNSDYCISEGVFRQQLKCIVDNGFRGVTINDYCEERDIVNNKKVAITFDDGWENNFDTAFPLLRQFNMSATIFIATSLVGQKEYLQWEQILEMNQYGISIQSHTVSHKPLTTLSNSELTRELFDSKKYLEDRLMKEVEFLSVPHGMIDNRVSEKAFEFGYKGICTSEPGYRIEGLSPTIFDRINIANNCSVEKYKRFLFHDKYIMLPTMTTKKLKNTFKRIVGYNNYRKFYRLVYRLKN